MAFAPTGGSSSVPSLPPPCPKSPPEYPDLYGKRREMAKVQMLEREIGFLEEELKSLQGLQPASRCCKEVTDFVVANSDPLIPTSRKKRRSCLFWKWLCGIRCFNLSWICCCCSSGCSLHLECPSCCECNLRNCCSCISCPTLKWRCCCCCPLPRSRCCRKISCNRNCCCTCQLPSCPDCSCCRWACSCPKCPKVPPGCCNCKKACCNPCCLFF
ncbi:PREDICTED: guanine nucleotide-binding protein subunit gamma 3 isoform X1 [Populus euphratica]|uniref:Guanine nucleotide-binding protein subunit gamma 3 isoform X1 n=1 Tax=Populus euphratica TaxID=75702 RepID=A0AAJ6V323_POPEU|nr:PREDICTED: guanine nucleotide-binding protein subunit gamma 3 isoform X1 [Populus euphratica]